MARETVDETGSRRPGPEPLILPHLFLLLECSRPIAGGARHELLHVAEVRIGRGTQRSATRSFVAGKQVLDLRVPDARMSNDHARITFLGNRHVFCDLGSTNGSRVAGEPVHEPVALNDGDVVEVGRTLFRFRPALPTPPGTPPDFDSDAGSESSQPGFLTLLPALAASHEALAKVATSLVPVLLFGETGTGKEVIARAIHEASGREGPFVAVNCGAIPPNLVEAQLFGHKRGAFSGASSDEPGFVRTADRGTLFLDEIGDLPKAGQAALLRVLQEKEVVPVGSVRSHRVDLRVLSATHQDLEESVARGSFRVDLLARLAGLRHELPPLRRRIEDLGMLVAALLRREATGRAQSIAFTREAARWLVGHTWPLNIRELEQCLSLAAVLAGSGPIDIDHVTASGPTRIASQGRRALDDSATRARLVEHLRAEHGNVAAVARAMGKARMQVQRWLKRFHIDPDAFREP